MTRNLFVESRPWQSSCPPERYLSRLLLSSSLSSPSVGGLLRTRERKGRGVDIGCCGEGGGETPPVTRGSGGEEKEKGGREGGAEAGGLIGFYTKGEREGTAFSLWSMSKSCLRVSSVKIGVKINS